MIRVHLLKADVVKKRKEEEEARMRIMNKKEDTIKKAKRKRKRNVSIPLAISPCKHLMVICLSA
jgi:hypothetical protein